MFENTTDYFIRNTNKKTTTHELYESDYSILLTSCNRFPVYGRLCFPVTQECVARF